MLGFFDARYDGFVGQYRDFVGHRWSDALREENAIDNVSPPLVAVSIDHVVPTGRVICFGSALLVVL
jgi:hypothetical protein